MALMERPALTTITPIAEGTNMNIDPRTLSETDSPTAGHSGAPVEHAWLRAGFQIRPVEGLTHPYWVVLPGVGPEDAGHPVALLPGGASVAERAHMLRYLVGNMEEQGHHDLSGAVWCALADMVSEAEEREEQAD
jgi:hypothetical protein